MAGRIKSIGGQHFGDPRSRDWWFDYGRLNF